MKYASFLLAAVAVSGCATSGPVPVSTNPDLLRVGAQPEGYPRTYIEPMAGFPGYCLKVTESWREDSYNGHTIWLKDREARSMRCPG